MKQGVTYAPDFIGENQRLIAEREFLKLQTVIAELAESTAQLSTRLERVASIVSDHSDLLAQNGQIEGTNAKQNERLDDIEGIVEQHEERLKALENTP